MAKVTGALEKGGNFKINRIFKIHRVQRPTLDRNLARQCRYERRRDIHDKSQHGQFETKIPIVSEVTNERNFRSQLLYSVMPYGKRRFQ